jgi:hypothetical protein
VRYHDARPLRGSGLFGPGGSLPASGGDTIIINNYYFNGASPMAPANSLFGR